LICKRINRFKPNTMKEIENKIALNEQLTGALF